MLFYGRHIGYLGQGLVQIKTAGGTWLEVLSFCRMVPTRWQLGNLSAVPAGDGAVPERAYRLPAGVWADRSWAAGKLCEEASVSAKPEAVPDLGPVNLQAGWHESRVCVPGMSIST